MDEMLLENEIELGNNIKIVPDTLPGIIKQLYQLLKNSSGTGGDEYWNDLDGGDTPQGNNTWGDVDKPGSAETTDPQIWGKISEPNTASGSSYSIWQKLFRYK